MLKLAVVYVHYRTPELLAASLASMRRSLAHWREKSPNEGRYEIVVVDNGASGSALDFVEGLPSCTLIRSDRNRGYAGGINLGLESVSAERYLVLNPDVTVDVSCVRELMSALGKDKADVVGPRCFWDDEYRLMMPPSDLRSKTSELLAVMAGYSRRCERLWRSRWRRHARRHWIARDLLMSESLTGAMLAFSAEALARVGVFDEGYALYFEETDWLRRAVKEGLRCCYVPSARAVHFYAQSTQKEPQAMRWFEESARRFRRRHYGVLFTWLLERLSRDVRTDITSAEPWPEEGLTPGTRAEWGRGFAGTEWHPCGCRAPGLRGHSRPLAGCRNDCLIDSPDRCFRSQSLSPRAASFGAVSYFCERLARLSSVESSP